MVSPSQLANKHHVPSQSASSKGGARSHVGLFANTWFTSQSPLYLRCVRAYGLAHGGNLVNEGHARCQISIDGVFCHLSRFDRNPNQPLTKASQKGLKNGFGIGAPNTNHYASGVNETFNCGAQA